MGTYSQRSNLSNLKFLSTVADNNWIIISFKAKMRNNSRYQLLPWTTKFQSVFCFCFIKKLLFEVIFSVFVFFKLQKRQKTCFFLSDNKKSLLPAIGPQRRKSLWVYLKAVFVSTKVSLKHMDVLTPRYFK